MLDIGQTVEVKGSAAKPYIVKNVDGLVWSCTCPAWRNSGGLVDQKTCKHVKQIRGLSAPAGIMVRVIFFVQGSMTDSSPGFRVSKEKFESFWESLGDSDEENELFWNSDLEGDGDDIHVRWFTSPINPQSSVDWIAGQLGASIPPVSSWSAKKVVTSTPERAEEILARAAAQGRKLRQDEKVKLHGPPVLLAHAYEDSDVDPTGWHVSEKLDGVRAYWDGENFISRQGNAFHAPAWFKDGLPRDRKLDGELWVDRGKFQSTLSIVRTLNAGERWKAVKFLTFDLPDSNKPFEERLLELEELATSSSSKIWKLVDHELCRGRDHLKEVLDRLVSQGAEGLMIRKPRSFYEAGRSSTLLKVKPFKDAEATVVAHVPGKGKHKGRLGGLEVRLPDGKTFNVGTGLTDEERRNPPPVGSKITYRFTELTNSGLPKCASFVAMRDYE